MKNLLIGILAILAISCSDKWDVCEAQDQSNMTDLDKYLDKKMRRADLIGMQVAYINQEEIWQGNYGEKEWGTCNRVDENTLFMMASISKPVTAFGLLTLSDRGLLDLDDPINMHLPFEVVNPNHPDETITIRMLLAHVSSIRDYWETLMPLYTIEAGGGDSPIELRDFLFDYLSPEGEYYNATENFYTHKPTEVNRYCNVGYALVGLIIEEISGQSFPEFMQDNVFDPLDMQDSYWRLADIPHDNIATPHDMPYKKKTDFDEPRALPHFGYPDYPDGQLRATAGDYGKFIRMMLNKGKVGNTQLVSEATIEEFVKVQYPEASEHQALSWDYGEFDSFIYYLLMPNLPSHTGSDPGVATAVSFDLETGTAAVVLTNSPPYQILDEKVFYQEIMKRLLKEATK
ncbi:MAG: serine hydrolase [Cyclobacteriaceae bacterium]